MLKTLEGHRADFVAGLPVGPATRRDRLRRAIALVEDNRIDLCASLLAEGRHGSADAAIQAEIAPALAALQSAVRDVEDWMKPVPAFGFLDRLAGRKGHTEYQPLGVVGFAAPATLPVRQTAAVLAGAFAAGNRVVVKLDASTPILGRLLAGLAAHYFDRLELTVLAGSAEVDEAFAQLPFDRIDDGSSAGRFGLSPAIMGRSADFGRATERLIAGKLARAGRTPLAPDHLFVPAEHEEEIAGWLWRAAMHLYPRMPEATEGAPFAGAERERIAHLVQDARARGAEIVVAEHPDGAASRRSMPLHIVRFATDDMLVMQEQIRGPILPLCNYGPIEEAIGEIQRRTPPRAIYYFGRDAAERQQVLGRTLSATFAIDSGTIGLTVGSDLPAPNGPGEEGFRRFSRLRRVFRQPPAGARGQGARTSSDPAAVPAPALH